ncbi:MAG: glycosyltransferase [Planctomycetales bacterium]
MRILVVTSIFPNGLQPNKGIYNWRAYSLLQQQAEVRVISPVPWMQTLRMPGRRRWGHNPRGWEEWQGVRVSYPAYYYTPGILRGRYGAFYQKSIRSTFRWALEEFQPDLLLSCWAYPDGWVACQLGREHGLPVAVKVIGSDVLLVDEHPTRKAGTLHTLREADAIFAVSRNLRDRAVELGANPQTCLTIYSGTDCERFSPGDKGAARQRLGLPTEGCRLLFVGNLVGVKAIDVLIKAAGLLVERGVNFDLDIIGEGPLRDELQGQISAAGLSERVKLLGRRLQADLPDWYRAANLVVLCSHSEGIPNVLLEGAACGTPCVATRVGGIPEIADLSPVDLVPPGNPAALADAIVAALTKSSQEEYHPKPEAIHSDQSALAAMMQVFRTMVSSNKRPDGRGETPRTTKTPMVEQALTRDGFHD